VQENGGPVKFSKLSSEEYNWRPLIGHVPYHFCDIWNNLKLPKIQIMGTGQPSAFENFCMQLGLSSKAYLLNAFDWACPNGQDQSPNGQLLTARTLYPCNIASGKVPNQEASLGFYYSLEDGASVERVGEVVLLKFSSGAFCFRQEPWLTLSSLLR
jgi:hypothetical protein